VDKREEGGGIILMKKSWEVAVSIYPVNLSYHELSFTSYYKSVLVRWWYVDHGTMWSVYKRKESLAYDALTMLGEMSFSETMLDDASGWLPGPESRGFLPRLTEITKAFQFKASPSTLFKHHWNKHFSFAKFSSSNA